MEFTVKLPHYILTFQTLVMAGLASIRKICLSLELLTQPNTVENGKLLAKLAAAEAESATNLATLRHRGTNNHMHVLRLHQLA